MIMTLNTQKLAHYHQEQHLDLDGVMLAYDSFGNPSNPPMLMIMGLGMQLINWDDVFCSELASRGFWVIRFDNRDAGNSTKFTKKIGLLDLAWASISPKRSTPEYQLDDMANDVIKLLDTLNIEKVHLVGASMGGMIAQLVTLLAPHRVFSLTSVMSTTGNRKLPGPKGKVRAAVLKPAPKTREQYLKHAIHLWTLLNGNVIPFDEERVLKTVSKGYDRQFFPAGIARQLHAILCAEDRTKILAEIEVPTLVIHGEIDPLIPIEAGYATAKAISHAEMEVVKGMGHNLPPQTWSQIINAIEKITGDVPSHTKERQPSA